MNLIGIPLDESVQGYLWTVLSASVQAGVAVAAVASVYRLGGLLGRLVSNIIPPAADAFLKLFAALVVIAGPVVALVEAAVVVYHAMRLSRRVETAMFRAETSGVRIARPIVLDGIQRS